MAHIDESNNDVDYVPAFPSAFQQLNRASGVAQNMTLSLFSQNKSHDHNNWMKLTYCYYRYNQTGSFYVMNYSKDLKLAAM